MKKQIFVMLIVASVLALIAPHPVEAQEVSFRATYERIDTLRRDLHNITTKTQQLPAASSGSKAKIGAANLRIESATDAELAKVYELAGPYIHQLSEVLNRYEVSLRELEGLLAGKSSSPTFPLAAYPTGPLAATYSGIFDTNESLPGGTGSSQSSVSNAFSVVCATLTGNPVTNRVAYQTRFELKQALLLAELIKDILGRLCDQEIYGAGIGGDLSLVCIVSDLVYHFLRPLEEFPAICDALIDSAEIEGSYDRLGHFHMNMETAQASITNIDGDLVVHNTALTTHDTNIFNELNGSLAAVSAQLNTTETLILNTMSTHDMDIENILSQNRDFRLRTFIERALRRELGNGKSTPTSVNYRLATLYLPETFGGNLEEVRDVVASAIASIGAAGEGTNDASDLLADGNSAFADGEYKEAWDRYADAYVEAIICPQNNRACR